ncbi:MAG: hypothetical protein ABMB14_10095 [Myxococcota bacterium]
MLLLGLTAVAQGGRIIEVEVTSDGPRFDVVGQTDNAGEPIVTWQGRPLELSIVADISVSVVTDPNGPAAEIRDAMVAAHRAMAAHPVRGDAIGVTVFGGNARTWVPLGPVDRPGLGDWLASFGPATNAPLPWATADELRAGEWTAEPRLATDLGLNAFATDPSTGLRDVFAELRRTSVPLKAVVVLWDGEATVETSVKSLLNRFWSREIHVFAIGVGDIHADGLAARGGGDVYLAGGSADLAIVRIIDQLKMPAP